MDRPDPRRPRPHPPPPPPPYRPGPTPPPPPPYVVQPPRLQPPPPPHTQTACDQLNVIARTMNVRPTYQTTRAGGEDHRPLFRSTVQLPPTNLQADGTGRSKLHSRRQAAHRMLAMLGASAGIPVSLPPLGPGGREDEIEDGELANGSPSSGNGTTGDAVTQQPLFYVDREPDPELEEVAGCVAAGDTLEEEEGLVLRDQRDVAPSREEPDTAHPQAGTTVAQPQNNPVPQTQAESSITPAPKSEPVPKHEPKSEPKPELRPVPPSVPSPTPPQSLPPQNPPSQSNPPPNPTIKSPTGPDPLSVAEIRVPRKRSVQPSPPLPLQTSPPRPLQTSPPRPTHPFPGPVPVSQLSPVKRPVPLSRVDPRSRPLPSVPFQPTRSSVARGVGRGRAEAGNSLGKQAGGGNSGVSRADAMNVADAGNAQSGGKSVEVVDANGAAAAVPAPVVSKAQSESNVPSSETRNVEKVPEKPVEAPRQEAKKLDVNSYVPPRKRPRVAMSQLPMRLQLWVVCDYSNEKVRKMLVDLTKASLFVHLSLYIPACEYDASELTIPGGPPVNVTKLPRLRPVQSASLSTLLAFEAGRAAEKIWVYRAKHLADDGPPSLSPRLLIVHDDPSFSYMKKPGVIDVLNPGENLSWFVSELLQVVR